MVAAVLLVHIALAVPPRVLPAATVEYAVAEAAAIWAPYNVIVDAAGPGGPIAGGATFLPVAIVNTTSRVGPGWRGPLGTIGFGPDGSPLSTITVYLTDILQFIRDTRVLGVQQLRWPDALRQRIVGRVIGRVIAHEIGHYVLQSPRHAATGLMRPVHAADALVSPSRREFQVSGQEASRLAADDDKEKGPAWAGPQQQTRTRR